MAMTFRFVTTIHMVSSAIIKLSGQTPMPEGRTVYRGLTGVELPMCFFIATMQGCRAGVEGAFMSCSTRKDVAMQYAGKGERPIIFEMSVASTELGPGSAAAVSEQKPLPAPISSTVHPASSPAAASSTSLVAAATAPGQILPPNGLSSAVCRSHPS